MIFNEVAQIIAKIAHCKIEDVKPESELMALGIDSLKAITVLFELEETFDIEIDDESAGEIQTVQDAIDYIDKEVNG